MELNRAQLLVYHRALEKFKTTHGIPANVTIEHPGPNDIPHVVVEKPNRILVSVNFIHTVLAVDTLVNILDKPFSASDLFHICTIVRPKKEPGNPFYSGNHCLCLRDPNRPQKRLVTNSPDKDLFIDELFWVSGSWEFLPGDDDLWSFPRRNGSLPNMVPPPDLEGPSSPVTISSSDSEDNLVYALRLSIRRTVVAGTSSSKANIMRFRNLKRVAPTVAPPPKVVLPATYALPSTTSLSTKVAMAVAGANPGSPRASVPGKRKGKEPLVDSPKRLQREMSSIGDAELWKPDVFCLAFKGRWRPWTEWRSPGCQLRGSSPGSRKVTIEAALAKLQLAACGPMYERVFTRGINQAGDNYNRAALALEFPESLAPYFLLILPNFNKEEFLNRPEEDEVIPEPILDIAVAPVIVTSNSAEEVGRTIIEAPGEWFSEETGADDGGDADQNSPS
ncbi:hypothetical protein Acr_00g0077680 [Actinidia rufa]|uniref:Uncharacterized protein n=1 Tax=Actinidia rufa TaxID=165716 RepID=A0A7J0DTW5_9ERIC|nr:hypothetical protein Acr_00g0077680 [Actinidia rufa]